MNIICAAALALLSWSVNTQAAASSSWLLMSPPLSDDDSQVIVSAPLTAWEIDGEFDSVAACQQERTAYWKAAYRALREPTASPEVQTLAAKHMLSVCVPTERLEGFQLLP